MISDSFLGLHFSLSNTNTRKKCFNSYVIYITVNFVKHTVIWLYIHIYVKLKLCIKRHKHEMMSSIAQLVTMVTNHIHTSLSSKVRYQDSRTQKSPSVTARIILA